MKARPFLPFDRAQGMLGNRRIPQCTKIASLRHEASHLFRCHPVLLMMAEGGHAELVSASVAKSEKTLKQVQGDASNGFSFAPLSFNPIFKK
jgi:hypothetical protein